MAAISDLGEGVGIVDADRVRYANEALGEILGYAPGELTALGSWAELVDEQTPPDPAWQGELPVSGLRFATAVVRKDGERRQIEVGIKPVELDGGPQALAIVRDITERKRNELALAIAYEREREAVRRLQQSTQSRPTSSPRCRTSCGRRSPRSSASPRPSSPGGTRWMTRSDRTACAGIASGGEQLTRLIAELLDFGRIEHGKLLLELGSCDLGEVLEWTLCELGGRPRAAHRGRHRADGHPCARKPRRAHPGPRQPSHQRGQVLAPRSTIRVRAVALRDGQVRVEVEDEGIGIPPGEVDRVFDRFHRLHRDATAPSGTGIGLATSRSSSRRRAGGRGRPTGRPAVRS